MLAHGTPGNRVSMLQRAAFLYKHGYNVLLFDFQSYGLSQGVMSTLGMVESEDILAAISFLHWLPDTMYSKIGVLGLSMGATAAVLAASRSSDILALVAESCPVDATRVLVMCLTKHRAKQIDSWWRIYMASILCRRVQ